MEAGSEASEKTGDGQVEAPLQTASGSEAECSLFEGLEGTPAWWELHSVLRDKEPVRAQGTMHVPVALQQDLGVPYLFHVQCKGMGQEDPVVLLLVLQCCTQPRRSE